MADWENDPVVSASSQPKQVWESDPIVPQTSPNDFAEPPSGFMRRLQGGDYLRQISDALPDKARIGKSLSAVWDATKTGWELGSDPQGFARTWAGINNATAAMSDLNPLKGLAMDSAAIVKPADAAMHLLSGTVGAVGYGLGQTFGEITGTGEKTEGIKPMAAEAIGLGLGLLGAKPGPLVPMKDGSVARMTVMDGKVEASPVGPMPTPKMVTEAAAEIRKTAPAEQTSLETKVATYWQKGIHPAEVVEAAKESPVMARDLSSAATPPLPLPERPSPQWLKELDDRFFALRGQSQASKLQFQNFIENEFPEQFKNPETQQKWYAHAEGDPLAPEMTPAEAEGYNTWFAPLRERGLAAYEELRGLRYPAAEMDTLDPVHMHRMVMGKTPQIDRFAGEEQEANPYYGPGMFNRNPPGAKERSYFVLESQVSEDRQLVQIDGNKIVAITDGKRSSIKHDFEGDVHKGDVVNIEGYPFEVKDAYTREIEANTDTRYYQNAIAAEIDNILHMESAVRATYEIQRLRSSPEWAAYTTSKKATATPQMPLFANDKMDPKLANVIDNHWRDLPSGGLPQALYDINKFAIGSLFWNPIVHDLNMGSDWFTARGWDNVTPRGTTSLFVDGAKALHAVTSRNELYQDILAKGGGMQLGGVLTQKFYEELLQNLGTEFVRNQSKWTEAFANSKFSPVYWGKQWMQGANHSLWAVGDMFYIQHVLSLERKGLSRESAIEQANRFLATYRTLPSMLGQKSIRDFVYNPLLFEFSRYHIDILKSYANMASDLVRGTGQGRIDAMGKVVSLGAMAMLLGPALSSLVNKATGTNIQIGPYGAARYAYPAFEELVKATKEFWPESVQRYYHEDRNFLGSLLNLFQFAPLARLGMGALTNRDWVGRQIVEPEDVRRHNLGRMAGQAAEFTAQNLFSPYSSLVQAAHSGLDPLEAIAKNIFGFRDKSQRQEHQTEQREKREAGTAKSRSRRPRGLIEGITE